MLAHLFLAHSRLPGGCVGLVSRETAWTLPGVRLLARIGYHRNVRDRGRAPSNLLMNIVDLRQTTVRQLEPLLEEESRHWRQELHWDYRGALELIKRFMEARALAGSVAFENGSAAGYSF